MLKKLAFLALAASLLVTPSKAAELVMFESDGCYWCERWKREVGTYYRQTAEARLAPLRRIDLFDRRPDDLTGIRGVLVTPTFVLVEKGREIGRIVGHPGKQEFWIALSRLLAMRFGRPADRAPETLSMKR